MTNNQGLERPPHQPSIVCPLWGFPSENTNDVIELHTKGKNVTGLLGRIVAGEGRKEVELVPHITAFSNGQTYGEGSALDSLDCVYGE